MSKKPEFDTKRPECQIVGLDSHGQPLPAKPSSKEPDLATLIDRIDAALGTSALPAALRAEIEKTSENLAVPARIARTTVICPPPHALQ